MPVGRLRPALLGTLFVMGVTAIVFHQQTLLLPLYLSMLAWLKAAGKHATTKLLLALLKNSVVLKIRQLALKVSAHLLVMSHRPVRRRLTHWKSVATGLIGATFKRYIDLPLWLRSALALALLALTASSSYLFLAILIIPQSLLNWLRNLLTNTLSKLGITQLLNAIARWMIPARLRHRWYMVNKWAIGRRQLNASRRVRRRARQLTRPRTSTDLPPDH